MRTSKPLLKSIPCARLYLLWAASTQCLPRPLSKNVLREVCSYLPQPPKLVKLTSIAALFFDLSLCRWVSLCKLTSYFNASASVVCLSDGKILGCGGNGFKGKELQIKKTAWEIGKGQMRKLADMRVARCFHGICLLEKREFVYVFGGNEGAEMYNLADLQWTELPDMLFPHSSFQPCAFASLILLCGGNPKGQCEVFNSISLTYQSLSLVTNTGFALTVCAGETFLTYSRQLEQRWSFDSDTVIARSTEKWDLSTRCPPIHYEGRTYLASAVEDCVFVVTGSERLRLQEKRK